MKEAEEQAANGRIFDVPEIATKLGPVVGTSRSLELWGFEKEGLALQQAADHVLETFAAKFVATCADQPVVIGWSFGIERQLEMRRSNIDLKPCMYRLWAAGSQMPGLKFEFRACTIFPVGTWQGRKKYDREELTGTAEVDRSGAGTVYLTGTNSAPDSYPFSEVVHGTVKITPVTRINPLGFKQFWASMNITATVEPHSIKVKSSGKVVEMQALPWGDEKLTVMILNDNKPCDPNKDVWSYH